MVYYSVDDNGNTLKHYGVKGQRHGVRRWQNEDGSLTSAGYAHYGVDPNYDPAKAQQIQQKQAMQREVANNNHKMGLQRAQSQNRMQLQRAQSRNDLAIARMQNKANIQMMRAQNKANIQMQRAQNKADVKSQREQNKEDLRAKNANRTAMRKNIFKYAVGAVALAGVAYKGYSMIHQSNLDKIHLRDMEKQRLVGKQEMDKLIETNKLSYVQEANRHKESMYDKESTRISQKQGHKETMNAARAEAKSKAYTNATDRMNKKATAENTAYANKTDRMNKKATAENTAYANKTARLQEQDTHSREVQKQKDAMSEAKAKREQDLINEREKRQNEIEKKKLDANYVKESRIDRESQEARSDVLSERAKAEERSEKAKKAYAAQKEKKEKEAAERLKEEIKQKKYEEKKKRKQDAANIRATKSKKVKKLKEEINDLTRQLILKNGQLKQSDSYSNEMYAIVNDKKVIIHAGIKGQQWGVRRFRNEDGTLTPEGRIRYGLDKVSSGKASKKQEEKENKISSMSDDELRKAITRNKNISEYKKLYTEDISKKKRDIESVVDEAGNTVKKASHLVGDVFTKKDLVAKSQEAFRNTNEMSDDELSDTLNRMKLEREYSNIINPPQPSNLDKTREFLQTMGAFLAVATPVVSLIISSKKKG